MSNWISCHVCASLLKCMATGVSRLCLTSAICSLIRVLAERLVSPTYWSLHLLHVKRYTTLVSSHCWGSTPGVVPLWGVCTFVLYKCLRNAICVVVCYILDKRVVCILRRLHAKCDLGSRSEVGSQFWLLPHVLGCFWRVGMLRLAFFGTDSRSVNLVKGAKICVTLGW